MPHLPKYRTDGFSRRNDLHLMVSAEKAIYVAIGEVEEMPADIRLTKAACLLQEARNLVADFLETPLEHLTSEALKDG